MIEFKGLLSRTAGMAIVMGCALGVPVGAARAQGILDSWGKVAVPAAPELTSVSVDASQSALLILDMYARTCTQADRPRCVPTIPNIQKLLVTAREHKMLVVYSGGPANATASNDPVEPLKPAVGEPMVRAAADKFLGSDLAAILEKAGIKTVIVTGTSADGAVLLTASGAALRNLSVVVPVDTISSLTPFAELYTVWHLKNTTGTVSRNIQLSRSDQITIR